MPAGFIAAYDIITAVKLVQALLLPAVQAFSAMNTAHATITYVPSSLLLILLMLLVRYTYK